MKKTTGEIIFSTLNYTLLILLAIITLYPFWHVLVGSLLPYSEAVKSTIRIFPTKITLDAYKYILSTIEVIRSFGVSIFVTLTTTVYQILVTAMISYVLTKKDLPGRNLIFNLILITMFFGGGLVPYYLLIKNLGMIDNILVLIIPYAVNTWWIFVLKTFFNTLPMEIEESAKIDGAGYMRVFFQIILPLSLPSLSAVALFTSVDKWNEWFAPMIFLNDSTKWPLTLVLRDILVKSSTDMIGTGFNSKSFMSQENIKMGVIMVSIIPILMVYPLVQKNFVKGVMIGAVKS